MLEGRDLQPDNQTWDPGGRPRRCEDGGNGNLKWIHRPNEHTAGIVVSMIVASDVSRETDDLSFDGVQETLPRTDLDSHANMVVVGKHCLIIHHTGRTADVSAFTPDFDSMEIPVVDAALACYNPHNGKDYILIVRNALHVPSMQNNLVPPFIMREAGTQVNDVPKIHVKDPTVEDHSIGFPGHNFRTPLSLWGVFSYFPTSAPTLLQLEECDEVHMLTPNGRWNPNSDVHSTNEENMLDWEGNIIDKKDRVQVLLKEVPEDPKMLIAATISDMEAMAIDANIKDVSLLMPTDHSSHRSK